MQTEPDPVAPRAPPPNILAAELSGDLPCVVCRYNLRGLSIRAVCPECGTAVRATILAAVDPSAHELRPLRMPRLLAAGLILWAGGASIATLGCWVDQFARLAPIWEWPHRTAVLMVVPGLVLSWLGGLALVRPVPGMPIRQTGVALLGVVAHGALVYGLAWMKVVLDRAGPPDYLSTSTLESERLVWRVGLGLLMASAILCVRPAARALVTRCLVLRTGRVDRQTLYAMAAACLVGVGGDLTLLATAGRSGTIVDPARMIGVAMVLLGGVLLTMGVLGSFIDSLRIARAVLAPAPALADLLSVHRGAGGGWVRGVGGGGGGGGGGERK